MSIAQNWGVRTLRKQIDSMLYERTALSKKSDELIQHELKNIQNDKYSKDVIFKDPYLLDFLELNDRYLEKDLEDAILRSIEQFIFELGIGFSFVARQKRIIIDGEDFKIDLLFYNRKLKRLIAIDLKIGRFKAEYKGQMELYLRWLSKYEKEEGENEPLGIILCADKKEEQIELLEIEQSGIHVAQYLTVLPPKDVLQAKLHSAIENAKIKYPNNQIYLLQLTSNVKDFFEKIDYMISSDNLNKNRVQIKERICNFEKFINEKLKLYR